MTRPRLAPVLLVLATIASACAGPRTPLDVGVREVANDITIGSGERDAPRVPPAPIPPTAVVVDLPVPAGGAATPRFGPSPSPPSSPPPSPGTPAGCPPADPLSSPDVAARRDRALLPVAATYTYGNDGSASVSGANSSERTFTDPTTRTVQAVEGEAETRFTYEVAATLDGTVTTTTYEVRNTPTLPDPTGAGAQAGLDDDRGLYLVGVRTEGPDGATNRFDPATPLLLLPFPAFPETAWDAVGTDATTGTTMSFHGRVVGRADVDACGRFVDAFRVELTQGRIVGPLTDVEFASRYDLATQFGGLSVHDVVEVAGTEGLNTIARRNEATIREVPQGPPA